MTLREGAEYLRVEVDETVKQLNQEARSRARRAANALRSSAMRVLTGKRSGKVYKVPDTHGEATKYTKRLAKKYGYKLRKGGQLYQASAPGESPANRLGNLRRNWRPYALAEEHTGGTKITARIKSDMPYSDYLDQGTSKMAARPYKEKVKDGAMPKINEIYSNL